MQGSCPFHINAFVECGYGGITKEDCNLRGCCYDETSPHRCTRTHAHTHTHTHTHTHKEEQQWLLLR